MSRKSPKTLEKNLWKWLKKQLSPYHPYIHAERLENAVGSGAADVRVGLRGLTVQIELKTCARPARPSTPLRVRVQKSQPKWHDAWLKTGNRTYVLLQVGSKSEARRYLIPGKHLRRLDRGLIELALPGLEVTKGLEPDDLLFFSAEEDS